VAETFYGGELQLLPPEPNIIACESPGSAGILPAVAWESGPRCGRRDACPRPPPGTAALLVHSIIWSAAGQLVAETRASNLPSCGSLFLFSFLVLRSRLNLAFTRLQGLE
jgi:hypothetical protein